METSNPSPKTDFSGSASNKLLTPRQIVERVLPSVVLIVAQDEKGELISQGSGFFFDPSEFAIGVVASQLVATNLHVFKRASQAYVKVVGSGATYKVIEVLAIDMKRDLCVVRVAGSAPPLLLLDQGPPHADPLTQYANDVDKPAVGDEVYVASNPKGLEGSFSKGIVSSIRKDVGLIQIDAAMSHGSSGGAVVNSRAEVIGIAVSSRVDGQSLNFAIPVEYLSGLELRWKDPVSSAGVWSLRERDIEKLEGPVQSVSDKRASYRYDKGKYYEEPAKLTDQSKYDLIGNKVGWSFYEDGNLQWRDLFTYDEHGFKTHQVRELGNGTQKHSDFTQSESLSQKLELRNFSMTTKLPNGAKFVYDRDGNEIEYTVEKDDGVHRSVSTYSEEGFLAEAKWYVNDNFVWVNRYKYETDKYGNWIKQFATNYDPKYPRVGFTPLSVVYREITYHGQ